MHYASGRTPAGSAGQLEGSHARMTIRGRTGPLSFTTLMTGLLALYFLVEAFEPFSVFRLVLGVATAALTVRLAVHGTLVASEAGVEWRTMTRTRHWPYNAISYFDLAFRSPAALRVLDACSPDPFCGRTSAMVERTRRAIAGFVGVTSALVARARWFHLGG